MLLLSIIIIQLLNGILIKSIILHISTLHMMQNYHTCQYQGLIYRRCVTLPIPMMSWWTSQKIYGIFLKTTDSGLCNLWGFKLSWKERDHFGSKFAEENFKRETNYKKQNGGQRET